MKTWLKILLGLFLLGITSASLVYHFVINKPHPDYDKEPAKYSLKASEFFNDYVTNRKESETKYNGQVIEISGNFSSVEKTDSTDVVVFAFRQGMFGDEGIRCTLLPKYKEVIGDYTKDKEIKVKGYCSGYNDTDVILIKCSIQK
jgi:uncharacterized protein (DUF1330 family)